MAKRVPKERRNFKYAILLGIVVLAALALFDVASKNSGVFGTPEDYELARKWEQEHDSLSFYDYVHVAIAKRLNVPLITRDEDLTKFAKSYIKVFKPEELIS